MVPYAVRSFLYDTTLPAVCNFTGVRKPRRDTFGMVRLGGGKQKRADGGGGRVSSDEGGGESVPERGTLLMRSEEPK